MDEATTKAPANIQCFMAVSTRCNFLGPGADSGTQVSREQGERFPPSAPDRGSVQIGIEEPSDPGTWRLLRWVAMPSEENNYRTGGIPSRGEEQDAKCQVGWDRQRVQITRVDCGVSRCDSATAAVGHGTHRCVARAMDMACARARGGRASARVERRPHRCPAQGRRQERRCQKDGKKETHLDLRVCQPCEPYTAIVHVWRVSCNAPAVMSLSRNNAEGKVPWRQARRVLPPRVTAPRRV